VSHTGRITFSIANAVEPGSALPNFDVAAEVWRDNAGAICARGIACDAYAWMELPGVAVFRFDRARRAVTAIPEPYVGDDLLRDSYYRAALPMALQFFGFEVLHASAACTPLGVVAFCAISETGKSTTVAALSRRGYPPWADDAVPFEIDDGGGGAHALAVPFRMRLDAAPAPRVRHADSWLRWPEPGSIELASTPLAALCVMQRVDSSQYAAEVRRLSAVEAIAALLPHAYCFSLADPDRKRLMMRRYIELAARVPTFGVSVATGLEKLPAALDQIERSIPGFTRSAAS
jgi:hypothetical protein